MVTAVAVLVTSITGLVVALRSTRALKRIEPVVHAIDAAVNGKDAASQTVSQNVQDLHNDRPADSPTVTAGRG